MVSTLDGEAGVAISPGKTISDMEKSDMDPTCCGVIRFL